MLKFLLTSILVFFLGISATSAVAEPYTAVASSDSATDQYAETIPTLGGNEPSEGQTGGGGPARGGDGGGTPGQFQELESQSTVGAEAARVATATAPETTAPRNQGAGDQKQGGEGSGSQGKEAVADRLKFEVPDTSLTDAVSGSTDSGLGFLFPLMLMLTLTGTVYLVLRGKRGQDIG